MKCLFLFIDALSARYLDDPKIMPRLFDYLTKGGFAEFTPLLGYSQTIKASIFTGAPPSKTDVYGKCRFDFENAPLKGLSKFPLKDLVDMSPLIRFPINLFLSRIKGLPRNNIPLNGLQFIRWHELEDPFNYENIGGVKTVFSRLSTSGKRFHFYGYPLISDDNEVIRQAKETMAIDDLTVIYLSALDYNGHRYSFDNSFFRDMLKEYDNKIADLIAMAQSQKMSIILFSDHGMSRVKSTFNIIRELKDKNLRFGHDYIAIIDSTIIRIIPLRQDRTIETELEKLKCGHVLTDDEKRGYGLDFSNDSHGYIFFLLNDGWVFLPGFFDVIGRAPIGMHGYAPELKSQHGIFSSNRDGYLAPRSVDYTDVYNELSLTLEL